MNLPEQSQLSEPYNIVQQATPSTFAPEANDSDKSVEHCERGFEPKVLDNSSPNLPNIPNDSSVLEKDSGMTPHARRKSQQRSQLCDFGDLGTGKCKQRAIVSYKFCIRHILADPHAPYKRCAELVKSKKGLKQQCTNAIKIDVNSSYCSTHLIMRGLMVPKKKKKSGNDDAIEIDATQDSSNCTDDEPHVGELSFENITEENGSTPVIGIPDELDEQKVTKKRMRRKAAQGKVLLDCPSKSADVRLVTYPPVPSQLADQYASRSMIIPRLAPVEFIDTNPAPVFFTCFPNDDDELSESEKLERDYLSDHAMKKGSSKLIKLSQKKRKIRLDSRFRRIPAIDSMCNLLEDYDFDRTDLFPLGLEPSDDEYSSDEDIGLEHLPALRVNSWDIRRSRLELYLLKKRLKRESEMLQRNAKISTALIQAAKPYPDSSGNALRMRVMLQRRRNMCGHPSGIRQCFYVDKSNNSRCFNMCLPRASMCITHIGYSVHQQLFSFCTFPCCGRPVSKINYLIFKGKCDEHSRLMGKADRENAVLPPISHTNVQPVHNDRIFHGHENDRHLMNSINMDDFNVTDEVEGDVSLASVAKELFDHELNDMLAQFPVDDNHHTNSTEHTAELDDSEGLLSVFPKEMKHSTEDGGHTWADISEFLRSEGYSATSPIRSSNVEEFMNSSTF